MLITKETEELSQIVIRQSALIIYVTDL